MGGEFGTLEGIISNYQQFRREKKKKLKTQMQKLSALIRITHYEYGEGCLIRQ